MAEVALGIGTSHSPMLSTPHEAFGSQRAPAPDLAYYEAVPYLLVMESIERHGEWLRRAEYPELPGCVAEAASAVEALEKLEQERLRLLRQLWDRGASIPVPRRPLLRPRPSRQHARPH